jgi:hypothetical protein
MKRVLEEELEVGKLYADVPKIHRLTTFLRFVGISEGCLQFKYVSGSKKYYAYNSFIEWEYGDGEDFYLIEENE